LKWTTEAESEIKKVPVFVRKRVRTRVEKEAVQAGKSLVSLAEVKATQARFISGMKSEVKGFEIENCFGLNGCDNRIHGSEELTGRIEKILEQMDLISFLKQEVGEDLKFHHNFRIAVSDCPNACSQPQIKDIGIIAACSPRISNETCSHCESCVDECREKAIFLDCGDERPVIDYEYCVNCGKCIQVCPTGTIKAGQVGYRVQLGGKLGRHPRLARELPGLFSGTQVIDIIKDCLEFYKTNSRKGRRFSEILTEKAFETFADKYS